MFSLTTQVQPMFKVLPNKPHLFSTTQHRFILIQLITLTCMLRVLACT